MRAATVAAADGVGTERIEIPGERGLPMRWGFTLDGWPHHWLLGSGSARRRDLSHSLIHRWRYQAQRNGGSDARLAMVRLATAASVGVASVRCSGGGS